MFFQVPNEISTQNANLDKIQSIFQRNSQIKSLNQNQVALSGIQNFDTEINNDFYLNRETHKPHLYEELDSNNKPLSPTAYLLNKQQNISFDANQIYLTNTLLNSKNIYFEKMTNQSDQSSEIENQNLQRDKLTILFPPLKHFSSTDQVQTQSKLDLEFKMNLLFQQNENQNTCEGQDSHSSLSSYLGKIGNLITQKQSTVTFESENASNHSISPFIDILGLFHTRNIKAMKLKKDKLIDIALTRIKSNQKRLKKSQEEVQVLENEFLKNPAWDYQKKSELALKLNMTFNTVQKWNFDRMKKEQKQLKTQK
eukprot:403366013